MVPHRDQDRSSVVQLRGAGVANTMMQLAVANIRISANDRFTVCTSRCIADLMMDLLAIQRAAMAEWRRSECRKYSVLAVRHCARLSMENQERNSTGDANLNPRRQSTGACFQFTSLLTTLASRHHASQHRSQSARCRRRQAHAAGADLNGHGRLGDRNRPKMPRRWTQTTQLLTTDHETNKHRHQASVGSSNRPSKVSVYSGVW